MSWHRKYLSEPLIFGIAQWRSAPCCSAWSEGGFWNSRNCLEMISCRSIRLFRLWFGQNWYLLFRKKKENLKLTNKWTNTEAKGLAEIGSVLYISYRRKIAANFWVGWGNKSLFCSNSTWNREYFKLPKCSLIVTKTLKVQIFRRMYCWYCFDYFLHANLCILRKKRKTFWHGLNCLKWDNLWKGYWNGKLFEMSI